MAWSLPDRDDRVPFEALIDWLNTDVAAWVPPEDDDGDPLDPAPLRVTGFCIHLKMANMVDGSDEDWAFTVHHGMSTTEAVGAAWRFARDA